MRICTIAVAESIYLATSISAFRLMRSSQFPCFLRWSSILLIPAIGSATLAK